MQQLCAFWRHILALAMSDQRTAVCNVALEQLTNLSELDAEGTAWAAYDWLALSSAGVPMIDALNGDARQSAQYWAELATPAELEAYMLAAAYKLQGAPFASRQIKRLIASLWRIMSPNEKAAFKGWIDGQE